MNQLTRKWQLDRVERAIGQARLNDTERQKCFWPCVHLASSIAGSDTQLVIRIIKTRLKITLENAYIRTQMFWERLYCRWIKGMSEGDYKAKLDAEFEEMARFIRAGK